jgi:hypothetical protein
LQVEIFVVVPSNHISVFQIPVILDNLPSTDYPQVEFKCLDGAQDLEVVATGQSKIHPHTTVANITVIWEKSDNVQGICSYVRDLNEMFYR